MYVTVDSPGHSVTREIKASWEHAFRYLSDPLNLGNWALGTFQAEPSDIEGLYVGTSLFSGERNWFRLDAVEHLRLVDCYVGDRDLQLPRISIRIVPADHIGRKQNTCLVTINAWRDANMDDERWWQLCVSHEVEILLIKAQLERKC
jgi:hypothetical protein